MVGLMRSPKITNVKKKKAVWFDIQQLGIGSATYLFPFPFQR